jgi:transglutaminase-like putative cysteine protease
VPDSLKSYLFFTSTMQVDHPDIKKIAWQFSNKKLVCERIKTINDYVFTTLKKEYTATFSSALETYKAGFGDCGEHAVLLAALLRASGIPARVVFGVVYMPSQKGYYYHAWVLAFDGSRWIFTDPAFGVFPANRDRVPLLIDDSGEKMISLARVIGRLKSDYITNK